MKVIRALFGLAALIPAAFAPAPASARGLTMLICSGDGVVRSIELPLPGKSDPAPCCAKACHSGGSRKKLQRQFDAPQ
ncbi:hypothetical protein OKA06_07460 [Novosphingobium sp. MW5]|nr:hypothetical protein [Novosphingobium sp. MW5]